MTDFVARLTHSDKAKQSICNTFLSTIDIEQFSAILAPPQRLLRSLALLVTADKVSLLLTPGSE
jgi:hypothetical protein